MQTHVCQFKQHMAMFHESQKDILCSSEVSSFVKNVRQTRLKNDSFVKNAQMILYQI